MCTFDTLYIDNDGYVVRCADCNHYQVAAGGLCITISAEEFVHLKWLANDACRYVDENNSIACAKSFAIGTPFYGVDFLFTPGELMAFCHMLEAAEDEAKALTLMAMFKKTG